jgi:hypothetical protein
MSSMIENFDSLARLLLEALLNTLWQGTLIAVLVWLLLRLVKRVSATTRHAVWLVTLLTIGALPILAVVVKRNYPAPGPAMPVKREAAAPAVRPSTPARAPEAQRPTDPFSLGSAVARLMNRRRPCKSAAISIRRRKFKGRIRRSCDPTAPRPPLLENRQRRPSQRRRLLPKLKAELSGGA